MVRLVGVLLVAWFVQGSGQGPYAREGDRVEGRFRDYRESLDGFLVGLRGFVASVAPGLLPELDREDPPPEPGVHGYQMLPAIVDEGPPEDRERITTFSYSWPITSGYIDTEAVKLERARGRLAGLRELEPEAGALGLPGVIAEYRTLVDNLGTIDQYLQYNRFWQRTIAGDRGRFDRMTDLYELLLAGSSGAENQVREFLGRPNVPAYVGVETRGDGFTVLRLPVYTDIGDDGFLDSLEQGVEDMWRISGGGSRYALDIVLRRVSPDAVYASDAPPQPGDRIDLTAHRRRFPDDGALLTTGAESTYGFIGDYVALGPGEITLRTLAHEFGHVLGFADGYIRGYRDLGTRGFEILELTSTFDDIMAAPREGRVLPSHFELVIGSLGR